MPLQSVDGNSCADGYMFDPDHDSSDPSNYGSMGKCVPNPDYESTSILDNPTILILLILVIVILIIMIRNNLGNRNN